MKNNTDKKDLLVTLADRNYIQQAKQLFSSVYWNAGWKGDYMLLAHEIPEKELKWFRDKGILIRKCKPVSDKGWGTWPATLFDKFYLFTPEFKKWGHVVYLDSDIIVRASLDRLTKVNRLSAVSHMETIKNNFREMKISSEEETEKMINFLKKKYNLNIPFFNSGVMVFSTDLTEEAFFENISGLMKSIDSEERMLNLYFYKKWKKLPLVYNVHVNILRESNLPASKIRGIVLHFASQHPEDKPWNPKNPFYKEWKANLDRAELIDLKNAKSTKEYSLFEIYIPFFCILPHIKRRIRICREDLYGNFHQYLARRLGIFLRKFFPKGYLLLKKVISKHS